MFDQLGQLGVLAEKMLANVRARLHHILHELAVADLVHAFDEQSASVAGEQLVPGTSPDDLDDVPAGAAKRRLQLLNNLAVAAHGAIQPLLVAVDDEDEVVEPFAR